MSHLGIWFRGANGDTELMVGLNDLEGLFQTSRFFGK